MMKKYWYFILAIACSTFIMLLVAKYHINKEKERGEIQLSNVIGTKRYLDEMFDVSLLNSGLSVENIVLKRKNDSIDLYSSIKLPCLLIYIPSATSVCMSCIDYAISSVKDNLPNIFHSDHCCIISYRPALIIKERVYKKPAFYISNPFNLPIEKKTRPCYFLITKHRTIIFPFIPEAQFDTENRKLLNTIQDFMQKDTSI